MSLDLSLNRTYWVYPQTGTYLRPESGYIGNSIVPSIGVSTSVPEYSRRGASFRSDILKLVKGFAQIYLRKNLKFCLALSGGIDSEVTAEAFHTLNIPFRAVSQRLFDGLNDHDIVYAVKYCRDRNIDHKVIPLSYKRYMNYTINDAIQHGQFTHAYSQIALTNLFNYVGDDEILVFSGHNPDFHRQIGVGWWEDSPNLVKYAIAKEKKFFTFTSLEPIFCHYAANFDPAQPGEKNNDFLYEAFPQLTRRTKMTGWEKSDNMRIDIEEKIRDVSNFRHQSFITWDRFTLNYLRQLYKHGALHIDE